ncbi:ECF transporter S component [Caproiciproducens faecalis]|uniref:ECF transporter S component n=1 Tax=Caproiciproducens faecalis TaxID=2820301 RepID=A0ABS7DRD4_9FIRM|nr:ECF transporter S component [Caproiciproducens faecalis]MBW7573868.1 ECF transporter S component [Caproiciproducens faecalis]
MKINSNRQKATVNVALTGLMGALVIVGTYLNIPIPVLGDKTMISLGNVFCILSGLLLGPLYGGAAAGIGSFIFDLVGGWASSAPFTLVFKFIMAFVCGSIAWGGDKSAKKLSRLILAAVLGSLSYCALYLGYSYVKELLIGSAVQVVNIKIATKAATTFTNAVIADVVAVPLFITLRRALARNHIGTNLQE